MPYTYRIYHRPTDKHYYGARWKPGCNPNDLWQTYFTSSKRVHKLIEQYGKDSFDVEIRRVFSTKEDCLNWEQQVLKRLKVKMNPKWINIAIGKPSMLGRKHSPETIAKMRKPKGPWSEDRKQAKRLEMKTKIANGEHKMPSTKGFKHRPETIKKFKRREELKRLASKNSCVSQT